MLEKRFGNGKIYDLVYKNKNYQKEVDFITRLFPYEPKKILELGCGTGNYTKILIKKGYNVLGLDLSEDMLKIARKKVTHGNFVCEDIRNLQLNEKYDACLALFAVLGYINENSGLERVFQNIKRHLNPRGFLIFDVWNGLSVLNNKPEKRVKNVENEKIKVSRQVIPRLDAKRHICHVNYKSLVKDKEGGSFYEINEEHKVRFFFPQELRKYLEDSGFEIFKMCKPFEPDSEIDETSWNMFIGAKLRNS